MAKQFISASELLEDSFKLASKILASGFKPTFIVGIWRGGAPIGIAVQELFEFCGISTNHIAIPLLLTREDFYLYEADK